MIAPLQPTASLLARQLLLGIRSALAVLQQTHPDIDARVTLKSSDYAAVNGVSVQTGPGPFRFVDMAPLPFAVLRSRFGIRETDYSRTLLDEHIKEKGSVGKSGSMFIFSADGSCILKTLRREEADTLITFLPAYIEHIRAEPDTLLNRFLGLYSIKPRKQRRVYFLAMSNCLLSPFELDEVYDIKGSTEGRQEANGTERQRGKIYKDLDFVSGLLLGPRKKDLLLAQLKKDIDLLQSANLMDYSLIVGIKRNAQEPKVQSQPSARAIVYRSAFTRDFGGFRASDAANSPLPEVYYLGVIDVLQDYNVKKQLAHGWKSMKVEEEKLSTVEPSMYATRFLAFVAGKVVNKPSEPKLLNREILPPTDEEEGEEGGEKERNKKTKKKHRRKSTSSNDQADSDI